MLVSNWTTLLSEQSLGWLRARNIEVNDVTIMILLERGDRFRNFPMEIKRVYAYPLRFFCNSHARVTAAVGMTKDQVRYATRTEVDPRVILQLLDTETLVKVVGRSKFVKLYGNFMRTYAEISEICGGDVKHIKNNLDTLAKPFRDQFKPDYTGEVRLINAITAEREAKSVRAIVARLDHTSTCSFNRFLNAYYQYAVGKTKDDAKTAFMQDRRSFVAHLKDVARKSNAVTSRGAKLKDCKIVKLTFKEDALIAQMEVPFV